MGVPAVLLSGHHKDIERWRRREALARTLERRPDLLESATLDPDDAALLKELLEDRGGVEGSSPTHKRRS
jgi:tRNA (guanine37-N1)-methyltransferase